MQSNEDGRNNKRKLKTGTSLFNPNQLGPGEVPQHHMMGHDMYAPMGYTGTPYSAAGYAMPNYSYQPYMLVNQPAMFYPAQEEGIYSGTDQGPASVIQVKS